MPDLTETQQPDTTSRATKAVATDRDVQRATLRDLVKLAAECAATESEIERRHASETEEEHKSYQQLGRELANKFSNLSAEAKRAFEQATAAANEKFAAELVALEEADSQSRGKVETRHDLAQQEIKKKYDHAVWLADSVYEFALNSAAAEFKQANATADTQGKSLDEIQEKGARLLETYKVTLPENFGEQFTAGETPGAEEGLAAFEAESESARQRLTGLTWMALPRMFVGTMPYVAVILFSALAGIITQVIFQTTQIQIKPVAIAAGAIAAAGTIILGAIPSRCGICGRFATPTARCWGRLPRGGGRSMPSGAWPRWSAKPPSRRGAINARRKRTARRKNISRW